MKQNQILKITYFIFLLLITGIVWNGLYQAQFLEYDLNYGSLIEAFLISVGSFFGIVFIWRKWKNFILENKWLTISFLIACSPVSIILVVCNYSIFFGENLKV
ncbi:hypothetical protein GCM10008015_15430 [Flavobacterium palustre]|uniref:Uncharacterized protein n=1 Tax=Flavobacterium palustre TaxID=1476463 RepID=A0ABQ1HH18_9FLAO|nr:hypothetical protein [Flavobacterium palustre]GGA75702.1 hypothetical protein GCM10008015_15430 [Flavobacterium palustre]